MVSPEIRVVAQAVVEPELFVEEFVAVVVAVVVVEVVLEEVVVAAAVVAEWPAVELAAQLTATGVPPKIEQVSLQSKIVSQELSFHAASVSKWNTVSSSPT